MALRPQLRDMLALIAERLHSNTNEIELDTWFMDNAGFPEEETRRYLNELQSLEKIRIDRRVSGATDRQGREYRMVAITREGIEALASEDDELR
jgi:hypothetical protein